MISGAHMSFG